MKKARASGPLFYLRCGRKPMNKQTAVPGRANGSRERAPDDRLRANPEFANAQLHIRGLVLWTIPE
jgi:hypothetical protein